MERRLLERAGDVHFFEAHIDHSLRHDALILRRRRQRQLVRTAVLRRRVRVSVSPLCPLLLRAERRNEAPQPGGFAARVLLTVARDAVRDWRYAHGREHRPHVSKLPVRRLSPFVRQGQGSQVPLVLGQERT